MQSAWSCGIKIHISVKMQNKNQKSTAWEHNDKWLKTDKFLMSIIFLNIFSNTGTNFQYIQTKYQSLKLEENKKLY